jgi:hypothetical protein
MSNAGSQSLPGSGITLCSVIKDSDKRLSHILNAKRRSDRRLDTVRESIFNRDDHKCGVVVDGRRIVGCGGTFTSSMLHGAHVSPFSVSGLFGLNLRTERRLTENGTRVTTVVLGHNETVIDLISIGYSVDDVNVILSPSYRWVVEYDTNNLMTLCVDCNKESGSKRLSRADARLVLAEIRRRNVAAGLQMAYAAAVAAYRPQRSHNKMAAIPVAAYRRVRAAWCGPCQGIRSASNPNDGMCDTCHEAATTVAGAALFERAAVGYRVAL